ncbi:MAG: AsmA-like C-terminal region-containing protein [Parahaliea sp.]
MRRFIILSVLLLILISSTCLATAYLLLQSPEKALQIAQWAVDRFTPLQLKLNGISSTDDGEVITIKGVYLTQQGSKEAPLVSVINLQARTSLSSILFNQLRGSNLKADNVTVYIAGQDSTEDPSPQAWMRHLRWLPDQLEIDAAQIISQSKDIRIIPLKSLQGIRIDDDHYEIHGSSDYHGEAIALQLSLSALHSEQGFAGLEVRGEFKGVRHTRLASIDGEVRGGSESFRYDLNLNASFPDIYPLLQPLATPPDIAGQLTVEGRLQGDLQAFSLSDARFHLLNQPDYEFNAQGDFHYQSNRGADIDLIARGQMADLRHLINWIGLDLRGLGEADATIELTGPLERVLINHFEVHTQHQDGLQVDISGALDGDTSDLSNLSRELNIKLQGPQLAVLEPWLGKLPVEPGPWQMSGIIRGDTHQLRASGIIAEFGEHDGLRLYATGKIDKISLQRPINPSSVSGVDLQLNLNAANFAALNQWLELSLPEAQNLAITASLQGSGDQLLVQKGRGELLTQALTLHLNNFSTTIFPGHDLRFEKTLGQLTLNSDDTAALARYFNGSAPAYGPVRIKAELAQKNEHYQLKKIQGTIDAKALKLQLAGSVSSLVPLSGTQLQFDIEHLDNRTLLEHYLLTVAPGQPLGQTQANMHLKQLKNGWTIDHFNAKNLQNENNIALQVSGEITGLPHKPEGLINSVLSINNQALLKELSGLPLAAFHSELDINVQPGTLTLKGLSRLGETQWTSKAAVDWTENGLSGLSVQVESPGVQLKDIGLQASTNTAAIQPPDKNVKTDETEAHPLETLIAHLPTFPIALNVHLDEVRGEHTHIDKLQLDIDGRDHLYLLRTLNIDYEQAAAELRGVIDLKARPPAISMGGQALDIDMTHLIRDLGLDSDIEGVLNIRGGLSARGTNSEQWLHSLDGNIALALEDAIIEGAAYDVLATDLLAWLYSGAALHKSTYVDCSMAQFVFKSGIATTDTIYLESPRMIASGEGNFDLVKQEMYLKLTPRSKNRVVQIPSAITLKGKMSAPKAHISPIKTTVNASAEALLLIPRLTMNIFGIKPGKKHETRPCEASLQHH